MRGHYENECCDDESEPPDIAGAVPSQKQDQEEWDESGEQRPSWNGPEEIDHESRGKAKQGCNEKRKALVSTDGHGEKEGRKHANGDDDPIEDHDSELNRH